MYQRVVVIQYYNYSLQTSIVGLLGWVAMFCLQTLTVSNSYADGDTYVYNYRADVITMISNSTFQNGQMRLFYGTTLYVDNNNFLCDTTNCLGITMVSPEALVISNNAFSISGNQLSISLSGSGKNDAIDVKDNAFVNSTGDNVVKIAARSYKGTITVHDNLFLDNAAGTTILLDSGYAASVTRNKFDNPLAEYEVKVTVAYSESSVVYATQNWWGSGLYSDVTSRIYDHGLDSSVARVVFQPYRIARNSTTLSRSTSDFFRGSMVIGGTVKQDTSLQKSDTPYEVVDDITIPIGVTLTVEAGTELKFMHGGIIVEGNLIALSFDYACICKTISLK